MTDFERQYGRSPRDVDRLVTRTYESYLYKRCETEKSQKDKAIRNARNYDNAEVMLKKVWVDSLFFNVFFCRKLFFKDNANNGL